MSNDAYNALKAFAFTVGLIIVLFFVLYFGKRYQLRQGGFPWYTSHPNNPLGTRPDQSEEEPRMCDVQIASWYPLRSQRKFPSETLGLSEGDERQRWRDFLVSRVHSINPFRPRSMLCAHIWFLFIQPLSASKVSGADMAHPPSGGNYDSPNRHAPPAHIQISTIILMPAPPPRPISLPSTSSQTPVSNNKGADRGEPQREYVLGTSYLPYALDN